jgi:hypothetical protein
MQLMHYTHAPKLGCKNRFFSQEYLTRALNVIVYFRHLPTAGPAEKRFENKSVVHSLFS